MLSRVHINDHVAHIAALRIGLHQPFIHFFRHVAVAVNAGALEHDFENLCFFIVSQSVNHARVDFDQVHSGNSSWYYIRNTPYFVSAVGALAAAERPSASAIRVSAGSRMPSSQSRAVE